MEGIELRDILRERLFSEDFAKVKPLCDKLVRCCSLEDIIELQAIIKHLEKDSVNALQLYLLFPFRLLLCRKTNEKILLQSIDTIRCIFENSEIKSWSVFSGYFLQLFGLITSTNDIKKINCSSEEFKSAICLCVIELVQNSKEEIVSKIYGNSFRLQLAQGLFTLLEILKSERSKQLRRTVLHAIGVLTYSYRFVKIRSPEAEANASFILTGYLPGLSICLLNVISGDQKQGQEVIRLALNLLADILVLVMGDNNSTQCHSNDSADDGNSIPNISKDEQWFRETADKIKIVVEKVTVVVCHNNWRVRLDLVDFSESILCSCTKYLGNCVTVLLPMVFALTVDNHEKVSSRAQDLIYKYSKCFQSLDSSSLCSIIEEDFYALSSKLIQGKLSANDDQKLIILKSLKGYIQILGKLIEKLLFSSAHLEKFIMSFITLLEFDTTTINLVEDISTDIDVSSTPNIWPKKRFCYFQKEEILVVVCEIFHLLGESAHAQLLIDYLIEKLSDSELFLSPCIFLMGAIVEGGSESLDGRANVIGDILETLFSSELWDVSLGHEDVKDVQVYNEPSSCTSIETYSNSKLFQICLSLETIEKCAKTFGVGFRQFLMETIFHVMERAGSSNYILAQSGRLCLYGIARSCGYASVLELIHENADYLVNGITLNFHHFLYRPEVAIVLRVVIEESDEKTFYLFADSIYHILSILDFNQDNAYPLLTVLKSIVTSMRKWFSPKLKSNHNLTSGSSAKCEDLKSYFLEKRTRLQKLSNGYDDPSEESCEVNEETLEDTPRNEKPLHVNVTADILKRCAHLQSSKNLYVRVLSLEIMELCILMLGDYENTQHPLIHELWNSFVRRFSEENIIKLQAMKVLLVIADECRDFVRVRVLKDVVPRLINVLKSNFSPSSAKSNFRNYQWTSACKLQLYILSEIGSLYQRLDVSEKDIAALVEVCLPYLKEIQPKIFHGAAFKTIESLAAIDADAIWFYFSEMFCEQQSLFPPHEHLSVINFPHICTRIFDFKLNF